MLRLDAVRPPPGVPERQVIWPVTRFRVRVRTPGTEELDPFHRLALDLAHAGEKDPVRIAGFLRVEADFIRLVLAECQQRGWLDPQGDLTTAGRARRQDAPLDQCRLGWMLRDDLTGQVLPWYQEGNPAYRSTPDGALKLVALFRDPPTQASQLAPLLLEAWIRHQRLERMRRNPGWVPGTDDEEPTTLAEAEDQRRSRAQGIEVLDRGEYTGIAVWTWCDVSDRGVEVTVGCPFGRTFDGTRYLRRLRSVPQAQEMLRDLHREGTDAHQHLVLDRADQHLQSLHAARIQEVTRGRSLPVWITHDVVEAEWSGLRAEKGSLQPRLALVSHGIVAEDLLLHLRPPMGDQPDKKRIRPFLDALGDDPEDMTVIRALTDRIAALVPEDDQGEGLAVPDHLRRCRPNPFLDLVRRLRKGRWFDWEEVGVRRQLLPFAAAALDPEKPASARVREALSRHRGLWRDLCLVIGHRNPASHGTGTVASDPTWLDHIHASRDANLRALDAVFPRTGA